MITSTLIPPPVRRCPLPVDNDGHVIAAETDPYGNCGYSIGNGDDFCCFDYAFVTDEAGQAWAVLHSVLNSETGSFIEDRDYQVLPFDPLNPANVISAAAEMATSAREWCFTAGDTPVRFSSRESYHFVREVALASVREGDTARWLDQVDGFSSRECKVGGARIDAFVNSLAKADVIPTAKR